MRDEDFFYEGAERGDLLDALNGHAHEGATVVLEGEPGSGVSTLLGMLAMSLVGDYELIRLDGDDDLGANAVVDAMLVHFGIERDDLADTLKHSLAENRLVILVDNAGKVPEAALATMASLKDKLGQRLTYVFGGEPGTAAAVGEGGLAVADTLVLPPLGGDDILALADDFYALSLDEDEAETLRAETGGRLGPLLAVLEERADAAAPPARKPVPWRHGLAVGALILVVLVLWLASGDDEPEAEQVVNLELPQRPAQTVDPDPDQNLEPETAEDGHDYGLVSDPERTRNALAEFHDNAADFEQAETRRPDDATGEDGAAGEDDGNGDPAPAPPTEPEPEADAGQPAPRPEPATTPDADNGTTATNGTTTTADKAGDSDNADDGADAEAPSGERTVSASEPELSGLDARLGYRQEDWLATRDDGEWFLQLVATGREDGARGVLDRIDRKGAYYRAERGENKVYLVLAGPYPSREAALEARETLPETLRRGGPFPREMGSIRNELR